MLILVLHALVESLMGLLMILAAHKVSTTAGPSEQGIMITYGFAALTMALVVAWFWPHRRNVAAVGIAMGILATFHTGIMLAATMMAITGAGAIVLLHGAFAASFWWLWVRRGRLAGVSWRRSRARTGEQVLAGLRCRDASRSRPSSARSSTSACPGQACGRCAAHMPRPEYRQVCLIPIK